MSLRIHPRSCLRGATTRLLPARSLTLPVIVAMASVIAAGLHAGTFPADEDDEKFAIAPRLATMEMANSTLGKVAPELARKTGIAFTFPAEAADQPCDGLFNKKPFWFALEMIASQTGNRIVLSDHGRKIALEPRGKSYEVSSVHGAFRVAARQVVSRFNLDTGSTAHDVTLDLHWEPRIPVFRVGAVPAITAGADDRGKRLTAARVDARSQPTGAEHPSTVRLAGITRESRRIAQLQGQFTVTASEKMLAFEFNDLTKKAAIALLPREKVTATLRRVEKDEKTWEFEIELQYPPNIPVFESFESWTFANRARLVAPDPAKTFSPHDHEILTQGSRVRAIYRFQENAGKGLVNPASKGWKLVYEAPSPPMEFNVPFELKDIPLP